MGAQVGPPAWDGLETGVVEKTNKRDREDPPSPPFPLFILEEKQRGLDKTKEDRYLKGVRGRLVFVNFACRGRWMPSHEVTGYCLRVAPDRFVDERYLFDKFARYLPKRHDEELMSWDQSSE